MTTTPAPPAAARAPKRIEQLGRTRTDDYAWMKDENWQQVLRDPSVLRDDIRAHLEAENAYTQAVLADTESLQREIFEEIKGRMKQDDATVPNPDGPWEYYVRYETGAQHPVHARRPCGQAHEEQVLVDPDALAKGHEYYKLAAARHSPDHRLFAYAEDVQGSEVYRVRVKNLAADTLLPEAIESCTGNFAWSSDSAWLFWTYRDENGRPTRIYRRPVGGGPADDVLVYEEPDPGFFLRIAPSDSKAWLVIACGDQETSEAWLIPASDPTAPPRVVEERRTGVRYDLEHWDGRFVIRTNADGAVDFKLVSAPEAAPGRVNWRDWVAHEPGRFIVATAAYAEHFVRLERVDANNRIVITSRARGHEGIGHAGVEREHVIAVDEEAFVLRLQGGYEYDTAVLRYTYESPTTPRRWFDFDMQSHEAVLRKTQEIPSGHDPARYLTRRLHARAADGAEVPITVLMRRDTPTDGSAPLLLYGYGSYGIAMEPSFSVRNLSLVDRGWIWATAHVRGGSEKGWGWFLDGRGAEKPNTFTDFIASAEHLADEGLGRRGDIVAMGGSAGGLLVGAVANMRPDLWAGIIANVPFVDVLNTMSDTSLPLTPPEWPEWGNPLKDIAAYDTIAAYSPYDNVAPRPYPAILATAGLSDPRVTYWDPAKWVARLRDMTTSGSPVLLRTNMGAGHGGAAGRFEALKETALHYAFALWAFAL
ncbi:MAG: S9 family peptidase [Pseudomonadota bacterium]|nr:S9 family peptidase [Pseudomonadota bacterium]